MQRRATGPSTLSRLFAYARTPASDPRENFTTEALAGAIRSDPRPMLKALGRHGIVDPDTVDSCTPYTQVFQPGAGTIDLMLQLSVGSEAREVWVEVKVDAPESGAQLDNYLAFINAGQLRRDLIVLARESLAGRESLTTLRWREVARLASMVAPYSSQWSDLVTYLEEIGMTENATYPISLREAASLEDAWGLFQKAASAILAVNRRLPELGYPDWTYSAQAGRTGWVTSKLHEQFVTHGRVMIYGKGNLRGKIFYGFVPEDGEAYAMTWIEVDPRRTEERQLVRDLARRTLDDSWEQPLDHRWQLAIKKERAIALTTEEAVVAWFLDRHAELRDAGLIELLPKLGVAAPGEIQDDDAAAADG